MNCERCKKRSSSVHLTEIIKGVKSELHLCESCAREIGLNSKLSSFSLSIPDMLSFLDNDSLYEINDLQACPSCGYSLIEINRKNSMGCPRCYDTFRDAITGIIRGARPSFVSYPGSVPRNYSVTIAEETAEYPDSVDELRRSLDTAVRTEDYEQAARLRDRIREYLVERGEHFVP